MDSHQVEGQQGCASATTECLWTTGVNHRRGTASWRCLVLTLSATSCPSRGARNFCHGTPTNGRFPARNLRPRLARHGQNQPVASGRFLVIQLPNATGYAVNVKPWSDLTEARGPVHTRRECRLGRIAELASSKDLYTQSRHPYTEAVLLAVPISTRSSSLSVFRCKGDLPNPRSARPAAAISISAGSSRRRGCAMCSDRC
jgi:hypothetical protein